MGKSILREKSYQFAIRIVKLSQYLQMEKKEFVLSKQVLRSGTAIGALIKEAEYGQSKPDFINETEYWLSLLKDTDYIDEKSHKGISEECVELIKMLIATIKTVKKI